MTNDDQSQANTVDNNMRSLQERYIQRLQERMPQLNQLLEMAQAGELTEHGRNELISQAHKLAGTGATYGFPTISTSARNLEQQFSESHSGNHGYQPDEAAETECVSALISACQQVIDQFEAANDNPESVQSGAVSSIITSLPETGIKIPEAVNNLPKLLVVDDDINICNILTELFRYDAHILTAHDSYQALRMITEEKPDLVLMDDSMPGGMSGLDVLERIQSSPETSNIPVIMITANDRPAQIMRGLMAGAMDYITKPFTPEIVASKVREKINRLGSYILIADDDESVRELLAHKFRAVGCKVGLAENGAQALEFLQNNEVGLALLDRMMPGIDGATLLHLMKREPHLSQIPTVFLTARHYGSDVLEGLSIGASDYITKPFNPDEVVARCLRLLNTAVVKAA